MGPNSGTVPEFDPHALFWLFFRRGLQARIQSRSFVVIGTGLFVHGLSVHGIAEGQSDIGLEFLVLVVFDDFPHTLCTPRELQGIDRSGICREPILTVDLLAICFETREEILIALCSDIRNRLSICLYDLEIFVIDPDLALKIALALLQLLWSNIENIAIDFVDLFLPEVFHIVFADVVSCENKRLNFTEVLQVFSRKRDVLQRTCGSGYYFFHPFAGGIKSYFPDLVPLTGHAIIGVQRLNSNVLPVDVIRSCGAEFLFLVGELLNDVVDRDWWLFIAELGRTLGR